MINHRHRSVFVLAPLVGVLACLAMPTDSWMTVREPGPQRVVGYWAVHVDAGPLRNGIDLFSVDTTDGVLSLAELPTRDWTGQWRSGLGILASSGTAANGGVEWDLELSDRSSAHMSWWLKVDTLFGAVRFETDSISYPLVGV